MSTQTVSSASLSPPPARRLQRVSRWGRQVSGPGSRLRGLLASTPVSFLLNVLPGCPPQSAPLFPCACALSSPRCLRLHLVSFSFSQPTYTISLCFSSVLALLGLLSPLSCLPALPFSSEIVSEQAVRLGRCPNPSPVWCPWRSAAVVAAPLERSASSQKKPPPRDPPTIAYSYFCRGGGLSLGSSCCLSPILRLHPPMLDPDPF